ncbi:MAG: nucleotidyl transferase AbiEii/AbiGii toxin family protein [Polyangiaceae bacterium]
MASKPLNPVAAALQRASEDLTQLGRPWALVGGLAVSVRAEPRMTRDVDITVSVPTDAEAEALIFDLQARGYRVATLLEQKAVARLATVRLHAPLSTPVIIDLLFASSGIEHEVTQHAEPIEVLPGVVIPVATSSDLIALKVLARDDRRRPQDWDDIRALLEGARQEEIQKVDEALKLIEQRGFHRGRSLLSSFEEILRELESGRAAT